MIVLDEQYDILNVPNAMAGHEVAYEYLRKREAMGEAAGPRAVLISCTGSADAYQLLPFGFDAVWQKPIPNVFNGTMQ